MLSRIFFSCLIRQPYFLFMSYTAGESMCFFDFPVCFRLFKTLCFFNYALMIRQDYGITSSLRRGALHVDSLSMGDEHLNIILATESDEFIKSCVENLVPNPSESEGENGCDVLACFTTFSNILFDAEYEFDSSDDQSLSDEDFLEKIFSNPLFEEEIISTMIDPHHYNDESDLIESMLNHDSSIIPSFSKINSLLDEFAGELTLLKSIPLGIDKTDYHHENEIRLIKRLFIEDDDDDSERDVLICEELLDNYSLSLPVIESYHFDIPSFSRPPAKPPV
nr:hypothetical protein [Tanacetum cinerariifolium]